MNLTPQELEETVALAVKRAVDSIVEVFPRRPDITDESRVHVWSESGAFWVRVTYDIGPVKHTVRVSSKHLDTENFQEFADRLKSELADGMRFVVSRLFDSALQQVANKICGSS